MSKYKIRQTSGGFWVVQEDGHVGHPVPLLREQDAQAVINDLERADAAREKLGCDILGPDT